MKEPYRLEGKKTMGYELSEQFDWCLPNVIVYPTGGGTGLIGMWKAFKELEELGWIDAKKSRIVTVQATGCASIVQAFNERKKVSEFWTDAQTIASGLLVPKAFADTLILNVLYESGGTVIAVTDQELLHDMKHTASVEGISLCPEGAAAIAATRKLVKCGIVNNTEKVVILNTGTGYKYIELFT
jgi:threonine synthase